MNKKLYVLCAIVIILILVILYNSYKTVPEPWKPVLEDTSFEFLSDPISEALTAVEESLENMRVGQKKTAEQEMNQAQVLLRNLKFYYIPMTNVRQLIYDADRLYYLKRIDDTLRKLNSAKRILHEIIAAYGESLAHPIDENVLMIDALILAIEDDPKSVPEKFAKLGHKMNLMAVKGELILE